MSRAMLFAEVEIELTGYAAIGAPESHRGAPDGTQPIARDAWGAPWVPPTSLAGSFRDHLGDDAERLMGEASSNDGENGENGNDGEDGEDGDGGRGTGRVPSRIAFLATEVHLPDGAEIAYRGRTAIDPRRGAARAKQLQGRKEHLPPGTRVVCRLRIDGAEHHVPLLDALATWRPFIGGGRSTGHGPARVVAIRHGLLDLGTREGRRRWLTRGGPDLFADATTPYTPTAQRPTADITLDWQIVDALRVGVEGKPSPGEPARLLRDHQGRPYVPGTTWKGVLRAHCGHILRSLGLVPGDCSVVEDARGRVTACGACDLCTAFGWTGDGTDRDAKAVGARSRLRFTDSPVRDADLRIRQHVALDRVFGGAADGLLFADEVVETGHLTLGVYFDGDVPAAVRHALFLALHDLDTGLLGIGGGTTRGYGTLRCRTPHRETLKIGRAEAVAYVAARRQREEATAP